MYAYTLLEKFGFIHVIYISYLSFLTNIFRTSKKHAFYLILHGSLEKRGKFRLFLAHMPFGSINIKVRINEKLKIQ